MIVATAGHVDHGKTLLVKALTGVDTDRLPEEKKRNLTIDLGFAYMPTPSGRTIGFIDVPGHERFIRNALCGLAGTDFVLFIVAADDGPMPQTMEHLAIIDLLGITKGAIALTKIDRVSGDEIMLATEEISELFSATGLADAPLFQVSAMTGDGIDDLREHLLACSAILPPKPIRHNFRLAVDRRFDIAGAGLVATGTVFSGSVKLGENVDVLGADMRLRVRAIHAQNADADMAVAGQRCALNLAGPELRKELINRGDWVVAGTLPQPVHKLDAEFRLLPSEQRPAANWTPVHVHLAAAETTGRLVTLEEKSIAPGGRGLVQLVLDRPLGAVHGDRFIVRDQSAKRTMGGGIVVDVYPPARGRSRPERLEWLRASQTDDAFASLTELLKLSDRGVNFSRFAANRNLTAQECAAIEAKIDATFVNGAAGRIAFAPHRWSLLKRAALDRLKAWHQSQPETLALSEKRVLEKTPLRAMRDIAAAVANELVGEGAAVRQDVGIRLPDHAASLQGADVKLWQSVETVFEQSGMRPLTARELATATENQLKAVESLLNRANRMGLVARISKTRFVLPSSVESMRKIADQLAAQSGDGLLMVTAFRDASGIGRNMTIEVLEYFDKQKFTQRKGEGRIILQPIETGDPL